MNKSSFQKTARLVLSLVVLCAAGATSFSQTPADNAPPKVDATTAAAATAQPAANDEKAEEIVRRALEAQGGSAFLGVQTIIGRGFFTPYDKGISTVPLAFIDYLVFPDRERTEFRGSRGRSIQTNFAGGGWLYESSTQSLADMKPEDLENFRLAMRTSTDSLLRGWWRKEGARLTYLGRREAGLAKRNEAVRLTYPDGFTVDYEIGAKDHLPAKTFYTRKNAEGEEVAEEDRFASYTSIKGINVPFIIDHFRRGEQTSRINYNSVEFNSPIADALFAKPANIKAIK
ncbi:MAG TPA: hypothetical protein VGO96_06230 [Pyrinomonadaceae bacterium]|jgi:hypothetical protein|nr:hypothetical protein [Pyrinomonadaceae bacterium]